ATVAAIAVTRTAVAAAVTRFAFGRAAFVEVGVRLEHRIGLRRLVAVGRLVYRTDRTGGTGQGIGLDLALRPAFTRSAVAAPALGPRLAGLARLARFALLAAFTGFTGFTGFTRLAAFTRFTVAARLPAFAGFHCLARGARFAVVGALAAVCAFTTFPPLAAF